MKGYESEINKDINLPNNIGYMSKKQEQSSIEKEGVFKNMTNYLSFENLKIIEKQKENSICKIINTNEVAGTGFLSLIPYPDKLNQLPVLITCNHVINGDEKEVKLIFNDKFTKILKLDDKRKIYRDDEKDIAIIEIKKEDNYNYNDMLEIDYNIFEEKNIKELKSIYIIHYPIGKELSLSIGLIDKIKDENITHKCATESGSSGAPIINLNNFKVIGINIGADKVLSLNIGLLLKESINNFNKNENKKG